MGRVGRAPLVFIARKRPFCREIQDNKKKKKKIKAINNKLHVIFKIITSKFYEIKTSEVKI